MISYEVYKLIHLGCLFVLLSLVGAQLLGNRKGKWLKIATGVSSLFVFIAGFGLLSRIGIGHGEAFPTWVVIKMILWLILAAGTPILNKKLKSNRELAWLFFVLIILTAAFLGINHD